MPLREVINLSLNDTLSRTLLTSITTLIALLILFFFEHCHWMEEHVAVHDIHTFRIAKCKKMFRT